jgi:hypothetical protein
LFSKMIGTAANCNEFENHKYFLNTNFKLKNL